MKRTTRTRKTTRPMQGALGDLLAPARADLGLGDVVRRRRRSSSRIASATCALSAVVSGSVWTRIASSPEVVTTGDDGVVDAGAGDGLAELVGVVLGDLVGGQA